MANVVKNIILKNDGIFTQTIRMPEPEFEEIRHLYNSKPLRFAKRKGPNGKEKEEK